MSGSRIPSECIVFQGPASGVQAKIVLPTPVNSPSRRVSWLITDVIAVVWTNGTPGGFQTLDVLIIDPVRGSFNFGPAMVINNNGGVKDTLEVNPRFIGNPGSPVTVQIGGGNPLTATQEELMIVATLL